MTLRALKPIELSILVVLLDGPCHGYALAQGIEAESEGRVRVVPGNLYAVLARLEGQGLVRPAAPPVGGRDQRRRYYEVTALGRQRLEDETRILARQVARAKRRLQGLRAPREKA